MSAAQTISDNGGALWQSSASRRSTSGMPQAGPWRAIKAFRRYRPARSQREQATVSTAGRIPREVSGDTGFASEARGLDNSCSPGRSHLNRFCQLSDRLLACQSPVLEAMHGVVPRFFRHPPPLPPRQTAMDIPDGSFQTADAPNILALCLNCSGWRRPNRCALPKRHDRRTSARVTRGQRAKARTPGERRTLIHSVNSDSPNYPFPPTVNPSRVPGNPCYEGVSGSSVARAHSARLGPPHAAISLAHSHLDAGGLLHLAQ